jgi:hypothetical protein
MINITERVRMIICHGVLITELPFVAETLFVFVGKSHIVKRPPKAFPGAVINKTIILPNIFCKSSICDVVLQIILETPSLFICEYDNLLTFEKISLRRKNDNFDDI